MAREQEKLDELDRRQRAVDQRLKSASRHESRRTAMEIATGVTKPIGGSGGGGGGGGGFGGGGFGGGGGSEGVVGGSATFQKRRQSDGDSRTRKPSTPLGKLSDTMRAGSRTFFAPSFSHSPAKSDGRVVGKGVMPYCSCTHPLSSTDLLTDVRIRMCAGESFREHRRMMSWRA